MTSIIVVLPAPLGPMIARISPGASVSDRPRSALIAVEGNADAVEIEQRAGELGIVGHGQGHCTPSSLATGEGGAAAGARRARDLRQADQALGQEQGHQHEHPAEAIEPVFGEARR